MHSTCAPLMTRAMRAEYTPSQTTADSPLNLLATTFIPAPVPQMSIARSYSPESTRGATSPATL